MESKRKIDAYIEPIKLYGDIINYRMYMHYNDIDYCFLHQDKEANDLASSFRKKLLHGNEEMMFTDKYGIGTKNNDSESVLGYVTGINDIDKSIVNIISACMDPDVQADLTVHLKGRNYPLVQEIDNKSISVSDEKELNCDVLFDLSTDINRLTTRSKFVIKKGR